MRLIMRTGFPDYVVGIFCNYTIQYSSHEPHVATEQFNVANVTEEFLFYFILRGKLTRNLFFNFWSIFYWLCCYSCPNFSLSVPLCLVPRSPPAIPASATSFMSMGGAYKFFGFYISYTILNILLSILYLPIMLLNLCTFLSFFTFPLPAEDPPHDPQTYDFVCVLVVCLLCFCSYFLDSVVDSCEFDVTLLFTVLIFFFLN